MEKRTCKVCKVEFNLNKYNFYPTYGKGDYFNHKKYKNLRHGILKGGRNG